MDTKICTRCEKEFDTNIDSDKLCKKCYMEENNLLPCEKCEKLIHKQMRYCANCLTEIYKTDAREMPCNICGKQISIVTRYCDDCLPQKN